MQRYQQREANMPESCVTSNGSIAYAFQAVVCHRVYAFPQLEEVVRCAYYLSNSNNSWKPPVHSLLEQGYTSEGPSYLLTAPLSDTSEGSLTNAKFALTLTQLVPTEAYVK